jgi:hypothetical protein
VFYPWNFAETQRTCPFFRIFFGNYDLPVQSAHIKLLTLLHSLTSKFLMVFNCSFAFFITWQMSPWLLQHFPFVHNGSWHWLLCCLKPVTISPKCPHRKNPLRNISASFFLLLWRPEVLAYHRLQWQAAWAREEVAGGVGEMEEGMCVRAVRCLGFGWSLYMEVLWVVESWSNSWEFH